MSSVAHITIEVNDDGCVEFICKTNGDDRASEIMQDVMIIVDRLNAANRIDETQHFRMQ
jgi:hypothetical protein